MRIAIVGSGISGLVAAHQLHRRHDVTVFEKDAEIGGYAHTVTVPDGEGEIDLDTGFLAYDEASSPILSELFGRLGVATRTSGTSFGFSCRHCDVEYSSRGPRGLFAQRERALRAPHLAMLRDVLRFHREGRAALDQEFFYATSLREWVDRRDYSDAFIRHFLLPLGAAMWSMTPGDVARFPLFGFLRCLESRGLLQLGMRPTLRTVSGGSREYVRALTRGFADRIHARTTVLAIRRRRGRVELTVNGSGVATFDAVVVATHADQALRLLADASPLEQQVLAEIPYRSNEAVLHTDGSVLASCDDARASWNVHVEDCASTCAPVAMTCDLNRLLRLAPTRRYYLTVNPGDRVAAEHVVARVPFQHPVYTARTLVAQHRLRTLAGAGDTWFCGAYLGLGFHEDGARSGLEAARAIDIARAAA